MRALTPLLNFEVGNIGGFQNRIHSVEFAIADQEANFYHFSSAESWLFISVNSPAVNFSRFVMI